MFISMTWYCLAMVRQLFETIMAIRKADWCLCTSKQRTASTRTKEACHCQPVKEYLPHNLSFMWSYVAFILSVLLGFF